MAIAASKETRERAKAEEKYIIQISISAMHLPEGTVKRLGGKVQGKFEMTGPATVAEADELWDLFFKWQKSHQTEGEAQESS
jgi:hypothetical protein